jgi:galacturan 1,4-alpha-galacturonidase
MGSIGQYPGVKDYISNAWIENVTLINGENGARLKAWAGNGAGYGYMDNITYKDIHVENTDHPVVLDQVSERNQTTGSRILTPIPQCYFNINATACAKYPSQVNITNVNFINVYGTSSGKLGKVVAELKCSPGATCSGIRLENFNITSPKGGPPQIVCENVKGGIGLDCVPANATTQA